MKTIDCALAQDLMPLYTEGMLSPESREALEEHLNPRGAIVVIEAEHMCMSMRGVRKPGAKTVTSAVRGALMNGATRAEAMSLIFSQR